MAYMMEKQMVLKEKGLMFVNIVEFKAHNSLPSHKPTHLQMSTDSAYRCLAPPTHIELLQSVSAQTAYAVS